MHCLPRKTNAQTNDSFICSGFIKFSNCKTKNTQYCLAAYFKSIPQRKIFKTNIIFNLNLLQNSAKLLNFTVKFTELLGPKTRWVDSWIAKKVQRTHKKSCKRKNTKKYKEQSNRYLIIFCGANRVEYRKSLTSAFLAASWPRITIKYGCAGLWFRWVIVIWWRLFLVIWVVRSCRSPPNILIFKVNFLKIVLEL